MSCYRVIGTSFGMLFLFGGCGVSGQWELSRVEPTAARRHFEYANLTLHDDGTFYAEAVEAPEVASMTLRGEDETLYAETREVEAETPSGTYRFEDDVLTLEEHDGETHTYLAKLRAGGQELELERPWQGRKITATFKRRGY